MTSKVVVIGLGYVGLPLAIAAAKSGYSVVGIDKNVEKVNQIKLGNSPVEDIDNVELQRSLSSGSLQVSTDYAEILSAHIILICVPTPLLDNKFPDLSNIESAVLSFREFVTEGSLVILESTVAPGTTRDFLKPLLKRDTSSSSINSAIDIAFSPERVDPLNKNWNLKNTPKIVAGLTEKSKRRAVEFYSRFVDQVIPCQSIEVAETAKLLENSFRLVNISLINELSKVCYKLGIEIGQVIEAAATKPYGFMPFYPSLGVGGHCIPVDPLYLSSKAKEVGEPIHLIDLASKINFSMPQYFTIRVKERLTELEGKKILVVGVSYKPNVSDIRETPVESLIVNLRQQGAEVSWHDDLVGEWKGEKSIALSADFDLAILATPHDYLDLTKLGAVPLLNTKGSS